VRRLWGILVFLIAASGLAAAAYTYTLLERERAARVALEKNVAAIGPRFDQFKDAVRDVNRRLSATVFEEVDLTATGWQPIAGGFYVIDLNAAPVDKNIRITGKVINPTSVTHDNAQISVRVGEKRATFPAAHLPPGVAQPFDVTVADAAMPADHHVFFALDGSTISFASSSTRKRDAVPIDVDKLLK
jgi:hypothetical protein